MVGVMLGLAILYIANSAPFLGVAQIVVYTGAIMMLFLFVIMLTGIGTSDDYARLSRGAIVAAALGGVVLRLLGGVQANMLVTAGVLLVLGALSVRLIKERKQ